MERFLVTSALPYANGPLHFGHLAGVYIPADIYCRHKKILGQKVIHVCGSDEHGVAITLSADKEGTDYQTYVDRWHTRHLDLFRKYGVEFDIFGKTSAPYHSEEVRRWFGELHDKGYIEKRPEKQLHCNGCSRFLPDRYVEGTCYVCAYPHARGDECPNCGEWIEAIQLKAPACKICSSKDIVVKESEHWYLLLTKLGSQFKPWFDTKKDWRPHVWGYVNGLLEQGLVDRAITRDLEWGIDVPLKDAAGKKLYVWFDAPIGYVSNTKEMLRRLGSDEDYLKDWWHNPETRVIHFIGKDNIIFHGLIWPCMIMGSGFTKLPDDIAASHFVNLEGKQFSKSAGWYVDSDKAIDTFGEDALRFYLASIIPESGDSNFSWDTFLSVNNELGNKIGNFINRAMSFLAKHWPDGVSPEAFAGAMASPAFANLPGLVGEVRHSLDKIQQQKALTALMRLGEVANELFHEQAPWKTIKEDKKAAEQTIALAVIYSLAINAVFRPFLPRFSAALAQYFDLAPDAEVLSRIYCGDFAAVQEFFAKGFVLKVAPTPLLPRIEPATIEPFRLTPKA